MFGIMNILTPNTAHSAQGDTIKDEFVMTELFFQHKHKGITKEWLYVALTRADLNELSINKA